MNIPGTEYTYTAATLEDIEGILRVQDANDIAALQETKLHEEIETTGFLVHKISRAEWEALLACPEEACAFVCKDGATVLGYGHGYPLARQRRLNPDWVGSVSLHSRFSRAELLVEDVLYYRQAAVMPGYKRRGIGTYINDEMKARAFHSLDCRYTFGEILKEPYFNRASYPRPYPHRGFELGLVVETYHGVKYTWALIKSPITPV